MDAPNVAAGPIDPAIARRAVEWLVELQSDGAGETTRQGWQRWLDEHAEHRRAWERIEAMNGRLRTVPGGVGRALLDAPRSQARRRALKALGVAIVAGGAAWTAERQVVPWRAWAADERTAVGQRRTVMLSDGSRVVLNTDSAIDIRFDQARRVLRLVRGEIMVTTGHAPGESRPFEVLTAQGGVRPLGTRFSVRDLDGATGVMVYEGRVELRAGQGQDSRHVVPAGYGAHFTDRAITREIAVDDNGAAWVDGMLVVRDMRLDAFLGEVARYRTGHVGCDPAVAALRVSGTYPLADTDRILAILEKSLPVALRYRTRYWVSVVPPERVV